MSGPDDDPERLRRRAIRRLDTLRKILLLDAVSESDVVAIDHIRRAHDACLGFVVARIAARAVADRPPDAGDADVSEDDAEPDGRSASNGA